MLALIKKSFLYLGMKKIILILTCTLGISFLMNSCSDKKANCELIATAISEDNEQALKNEINKLCASLKPSKSSGDEYGQEKNFTKLTERITENCDMTVSDICYACIESNPPISKFKLTFMIDTTTYVRTIEVGMTPYYRLQYHGIKE